MPNIVFKVSGKKKNREPMAEITSKNFFYINSYIVSFLGLAFFF